MSVLIVPDLDSLSILLILIVISVGATFTILYLMKLVHEKYSRRKFR